MLLLKKCWKKLLLEGQLDKHCQYSGMSSPVEFKLIKPSKQMLLLTGKNYFWKGSRTSIARTLVSKNIGIACSLGLVKNIKQRAWSCKANNL